MDNFIQITVFCPPEPRVGAFVYRNAGKVYLAKISRDDTFMWLKDRQAMITFMKNFPDLRVGLLWDEEVTNSKA